MQNTLQESRQRVTNFVETKRFDLFILMLICLNSIVLGMMTSVYFDTNFGGILYMIDRLCLAIFIVEMALKLYGYGQSFFKSRWNTFDLVIVGLSAFSFATPFIIFRAFRLFRILKYINRFSRLRRIITAFQSLLPNFVAFVLVFGVLLYVFAIIAVNLFGARILNFENLSVATLTLLQVFTLDGWVQITNAVMNFYPHAWVFFISYIAICLMLLLSFIMSLVDEIVRRDLAYHNKKRQQQRTPFQRR